MLQPAVHSDSQACRHCSRSGFSLLESLIATVVLSIVSFSLIPVLAAGRFQLDLADVSIRGVQLGEHLLEEIVVRDYYAIGGSRADWGIDGYDGFLEDPGSLSDFTGDLYDTVDQRFSRSVSVVPDSVTVPDLGGVTVDGKLVTVTVTGPDTNQWVLTRFVGEPHSP